jgi:hypothetical protein
MGGMPVQSRSTSTYSIILTRPEHGLTFEEVIPTAEEAQPAVPGQKRVGGQGRPIRCLRVVACVPSQNLLSIGSWPVCVGDYVIGVERSTSKVGGVGRALQLDVLLLAKDGADGNHNRSFPMAVTLVSTTGAMVAGMPTVATAIASELRMKTPKVKRSYKRKQVVSAQPGTATATGLDVNSLDSPHLAAGPVGEADVPPVEGAPAEPAVTVPAPPVKAKKLAFTPGKATIAKPPIVHGGRGHKRGNLETPASPETRGTTGRRGRVTGVQRGGTP